MATREKKQGGKPDTKKAGDQRAGGRTEHAGADTPAPVPRLRTYYTETVRPRLQQQFGLTNVHEIPRLTKIVVNVGLGEAVKSRESFQRALAVDPNYQPARDAMSRALPRDALLRHVCGCAVDCLH